MKDYEKLLEKEVQQYASAVGAIAEEAFNEVVKAYLDKKALALIGGWGGWWFHFTSKTPDSVIKELHPDTKRIAVHFVDKEKLPKEITDVLNLDIPYWNNNLGSFMPEYNKEISLSLWNKEHEKHISERR